MCCFVFYILIINFQKRVPREMLEYRWDPQYSQILYVSRRAAEVPSDKRSSRHLLIYPEPLELSSAWPISLVALISMIVQNNIKEFINRTMIKNVKCNKSNCIYFWCHGSCFLDSFLQHLLHLFVRLSTIPTTCVYLNLVWIHRVKYRHYWIMFICIFLWNFILFCKYF